MIDEDESSNEDDQPVSHKKKANIDIKNADLFDFNFEKRNAVTIMFSGIQFIERADKKLKEKFEKLKPKIITDRTKHFNILIQREYNRTIKFLVAINRGAFIVSYNWLEDCVKKNTLI